MTIHHILASEACRRCNPDDFSFKNTSEIEKISDIIGQERALEAMDFGIGIRRPGFNLFVIGPEGSGRHSIIQSFIASKTKEENTPNDWCYVEQFKQPHSPLALEFPPSMGMIFQHEMQELITTLKTTIPDVFNSDNYLSRKNRINSTLQQNIERLYNEVENRAKEEHIAVIKTEDGILFTAMDKEGNPLNLDQFLKLEEPTRKRFEKLIEKYQEELHQAIHQISLIKGKAEEDKQKLKQNTGRDAIHPLIKTLKHKYQDNEPVLQYLEAVENHIIGSINNFLGQRKKEESPIIQLVAQAPSFDEYKVNTLISNENHGEPAIYEDLPSYPNLHGRIEHRAAMGVLSTHFTLIKPGALHRANGGYLIIDAARLLMQPFAYEGLKRTLRSGQIRIEPVERLLGLMSTVTLEPAPIPLNVKIILVGDPWIYYMLNHYDPEFPSLFKVQVDFEEDMNRDKDSLQLFGALIGTIARDQELLPLHRTAVARVVDEAGRRAGDCEKLSLHIRGLADLIQEADYLTRKKGQSEIKSTEIDEALTATRRRSGRVRARIAETIDQGTHRIETSGARIGQINGLSFINLGNDMFGCPTQITATTRPGDGEIIDIEREVELGGPHHSKGVLILSAFLGSHYARSIPLSLHASVVFEQSYSEIDGDSASCAELCALLSSLAQVPIKQSLAITGSISQLGEVQAIGGVNEKIEGFFDLCQRRGLREGQGVIIPATNIRHLMLKQEVVDAITAGTFSIYGVEQVDEAIELLTGMPAGKRDSDGQYNEGSFNQRIEETLLRFASDIQEFKKSTDTDNPEGNG